MTKHKKIIIRRNSNGDTRTANKNVSYEDFHEANISHIDDVYDTMTYLAHLLKIKANNHDCTKLDYEQDFIKTLRTLCKKVRALPIASGTNCI